MDIQKVSAVLTLLAVRYPGGIKQFKEDGGSLSAIPSPSNDLVITHPGLPDDIKAMLTQMIEQNVGQQEVHPVLQEVPNFEGMPHEVKRSKLVELARKLEEIHPTITISETPGILIIQAPKTNIRSERMNRISGAVKWMEGLSLAYVVTEQGCRIVKGPAWRDTDIKKVAVEPPTEDEQRQLRSEIDRLISESGGIHGDSG